MWWPPDQPLQASQVGTPGKTDAPTPQEASNRSSPWRPGSPIWCEGLWPSPSLVNHLEPFPQSQRPNANNKRFLEQKKKEKKIYSLFYKFFYMILKLIKITHIRLNFQISRPFKCNIQSFCQFHKSHNNSILKKHTSKRWLMWMERTGHTDN